MVSHGKTNAVVVCNTRSWDMNGQCCKVGLGLLVIVGVRTEGLCK